MTASTRTVVPDRHRESVPELVQAEQVRMAFGHGALATLAATVFAFALAWHLQGLVADRWVIGWLVMKTLIAVPRLAFGALFDRRAVHPLAWLATGQLLLAIDGVVWGATGAVLLMSGDRAGITELVATISGVATVSTLKLQAHRRACLSHAVPMLVLPILCFAARGDSFGAYGAIAISMYLYLLLDAVRKVERQTLELLTLRFENVELTQSLSSALDEANQDARAKDAFLANMSHELRTPLHGILGLARMLHHSVGTADRATVAMIRRSGDHLLQLINNVLEFSRFSARGIDIEPQEVDLARTIEDAIAMCQSNANDRRVDLSESILLPIPCIALVDPLRLRQVLLNLIGNALKFTDAGGAVRVVVRELDGGRQLSIAVVDTGIGMSQATMAQLFEPFAQGDTSATRRHSGTGLGLNIARAICQKMGGDITFKSALGSGSTFTVILPLVAAQPRADAPTRGVRSTDSAFVEERFGGGTALLAEDNEVNALVGEYALRRLGVDVVQAVNGAAVVERMCTNGARPDMVFLDCQMPVMDGFEAARLIRAFEKRHGLPAVPLVALTANVFQSDRDRCRDAGMDAFLAKPFGDEQLREVLEAFSMIPRPSDRSDSAYAALLL
ncbi:MAG TPA: ATP-binding protein [Burkholderiaceae bacterium]